MMFSRSRISWNHISKRYSHRGMAMQGRQLAVIIQDGIWILFPVFHINRNSLVGTDQPSWPITKAQSLVLLTIAWRNAHCLDCIWQSLLRLSSVQTSFFRNMVAIDGRDIKILHRLKHLVFHPNFLALVDKRIPLRKT